MILCLGCLLVVDVFHSILERLRCLRMISKTFDERCRSVWLSVAKKTAEARYGSRKRSSNSQLIHPKLQNMQQKAPRTTSHASRPPSGLSLGSNAGGGVATASCCPSSPNVGLSAVATAPFSSSFLLTFLPCSGRSKSGFEPMTVSWNDECEDCVSKLCFCAAIVIRLYLYVWQDRTAGNAKV